MGSITCILHPQNTRSRVGTRKGSFLSRGNVRTRGQRWKGFAVLEGLGIWLGSAGAERRSLGLLSSSPLTPRPFEGKLWISGSFRFPSLQQWAVCAPLSTRKYCVCKRRGRTTYPERHTDAKSHYRCLELRFPGVLSQPRGHIGKVR